MLIVAACSAPAPIEPRPWELDVPEGVREIVYAPIPDEDREGQRVELTEDLVIESEDDENEQFTRVWSAGVDERGRIYVVDTGNMRVQVFEEDGKFLTTLGRGGEGPGEFGMPSTVAISAGRVFIGDFQGRKISVWSTEDHAHLKDIASADGHSGLVGPRPDGTVLGSTMTFHMSTDGNSARPEVFMAVSIIAEDGTVGESLLEVNLNNVPLVVRGTRRSFFDRGPHAVPSIVGAADGGMYYSLGSEYQVMALDPAGEPRWAMQMPVPPVSVSNAVRGDVLEFVRDRQPDVIASELNLPEYLPLVGRLRVDGHGRLHVFHAAPDWKDPDADRPVDIYAPDGELLFSGFAPATDWTAAHGDFVYGTGLDPIAEEYRVYRWRLEVPYN